MKLKLKFNMLYQSIFKLLKLIVNINNFQVFLKIFLFTTSVFYT